MHAPKPRLMRWLCMGIIRVKLTDACMNWSHAIDNKKIIKELKALNRLACMTLTTTTHTTPQASLELIANLPPLDIHIREIAIRTYNRIKTSLDTPWSPPPKASTSRTSDTYKMN